MVRLGDVRGDIELNYRDQNGTDAGWGDPAVLVDNEEET